MHKGLLGILVLLSGIVAPALAGVVVYEEGDKKLEVGGRLQIQYLRIDPDGGETQDRLFFRRLRPYIQGTVTKNWLGKIQFDFGESLDENEVKVKDAYMQYSGLDRHKITIGNAKSVFSREFLASSKRQQFIERTFSGDHNFGTPDRQIGVRLDGHSEGKRVSYAATVGMESHDPAARVMDFDTPANDIQDWNEGPLVSARIDFHPLGFMKFDQADFHSDAWKVSFGAGLFTWSNDDDRNTYTDSMGNATDPDKPDLDSAEGVEIGVGTRGHGFSADLAYQRIDGETVDSSFTGGLYRNGETELDKLSFESGYLFEGTNLEVVAGWDTFDADNYEDSYDRTIVGLNYYLNQHKAKLQLTYSMVDNFLGVAGDDQDTLQVQAQFVF